MRKSMKYPIRFWALVLAGLLLYQFSSGVSAASCKYERDIDLSLDLSASDVLMINAAAGDLEVTGVSGTDQAMIHARVCASKLAWLEDSDVFTATGRDAEISVNLPNINGGWSLTGNSYVWADLQIKVPAHMPLEIRDSSGDIYLKDIAAVNLEDSSGDIEIENARGAVVVRDSSGDININGTEGDVTIESDSSGDIDASHINGNVLVMTDSSGDIDVSDVSDNVVIERDSSGDISAHDVGGDFRVLKDGSGSIRSNNVSGEVQIPNKKD